MRRSRSRSPRTRRHSTSRLRALLGRKAREGKGRVSTALHPRPRPGAPSRPPPPPPSRRLPRTRPRWLGGQRPDLAGSRLRWRPARGGGRPPGLGPEQQRAPAEGAGGLRRRRAAEVGPARGPLLGPGQEGHGEVGLAHGEGSGGRRGRALFMRGAAPPGRAHIKAGSRAR